MFSTTPGGTRIVYDRTFLLKYRSSELGKTPPTNLPEIPGVTVPEKKHEVKEETTPRPSDWRQALPFMNRNPLHQNQQQVRQQAAQLPFIPGMPPLQHFQPDHQMSHHAAGPLQQYRQRSFIQQSSQLYKNMCEQVASMHEAFKQVLQKDPNSSSVFVDDTNRPQQQQQSSQQFQQPQFDFQQPPRSQGDGPWQDGEGRPSAGQPKKSQLSAWREAKMHAALEQYFNAAATTQAAAAMAQAVTVNGQHIASGNRSFVHHHQQQHQQQMFGGEAATPDSVFNES